MGNYMNSKESVQKAISVTEPFAIFSDSHVKVIKFLTYITSLYSVAVRAVDLHLAEVEAINTGVKLPQENNTNRVFDIEEKVTFVEEIQKDLWNVIMLTEDESYIAELLLCRIVESFLAYLSDLLILIFKTKPEILRSTKTEQLEFILQFQTMEELIAALSEKKANELAYQSLTDISKYFEDKLGLPIFDTVEAKELTCTLSEIRNVIVHARGTITSIFKKRLPNYSGEIGGKIALNLSEVAEHTDFLARLALNLDNQASSKFNLIKQPIDSSLEEVEYIQRNVAAFPEVSERLFRPISGKE